MPIIQAYKCDQTCKLFEHRSDYEAHRRMLANERRRARAQEKRASDRLAFFQPLYDSISFDDVRDWFLKNGRELAIHNIGRAPAAFRFTDFTLDVRWSMKVSNSHSAPRGKRTNWCGTHDDEPRHYPGWTGRVRFSHAQYLDTGFNDLLKGTGVNTGTGGLASVKDGVHHYAYDVSLFELDFPAMTVYQRLAGVIP